MDAGVSHMLGQWRALKVSNQGQEKDSSWFISPIGDGIGKLSRLYVVGRVTARVMQWHRPKELAHMIWRQITYKGLRKLHARS